MNFDFIKSFISLIVAFIPLAILLATILANRTERTDQPLDSSLLQVCSIVRTPIDAEQWKSIVKRNHLSNSKIIFLGFIIYVLMIAIGILVGYETLNVWIVIIIITLALLFVFFLPLILEASYKYRLNNSDDAKYFLFKDVLILVEADYHCLFNKCHEALRSMNFRVSEIKETAGYLEAIQGSILRRRPVKLKIHITKEENTEKANTVTLSYEFIDKISINYIYVMWYIILSFILFFLLIYLLNLLIDKIFNKFMKVSESDLKSLDELKDTSELTNQFINRLISRLKEEKGNNKSLIDISFGGEG